MMIRLNEKFLVGNFGVKFYLVIDLLAPLI
jgi:hypothetical protein